MTPSPLHWSEGSSAMSLPPQPSPWLSHKREREETACWSPIISQDDSMDDDMDCAYSPPAKRHRPCSVDTLLPGMVSAATSPVAVGKAPLLEWWKRPQRNSRRPAATLPHATSDATNARLVCVVCEGTFETPREEGSCASSAATKSLLHYFAHKPHRPQVVTPPPVTSPSACTFCQRNACPTCLHSCEGCQKHFCKFCISLDYHTAYARSLCPDCAIFQQPDRANVIAMQL